MGGGGGGDIAAEGWHGGGSLWVGCPHCEDAAAVLGSQYLEAIIDCPFGVDDSELSCYFEDSSDTVSVSSFDTASLCSSYFSASEEERP